jgi:hypothetical protein
VYQLKTKHHLKNMSCNLASMWDQLWIKYHLKNVLKITHRKCTENKYQNAIRLRKEDSQQQWSSYKLKMHYCILS